MPLSLKPQNKGFIAELVYVTPVTQLWLGAPFHGAALQEEWGLSWVSMGKLGEQRGGWAVPRPRQTVPISSLHTKGLSLL